MRTSSCDVGGAGWLLCAAIAFAQFGRSNAALTTGKISWSGGPSNYYGCERFWDTSSIWCDGGCVATQMTSCPDTYGRCNSQCGNSWSGYHYACMCATNAPTSFPTSAPVTSAPTSAPNPGSTSPTESPVTTAPTESPTMLAAPTCKSGEILVKTTTYSYGGEISWTLGAQGAPPTCNGSSFNSNDYAYTCCPVLVSPASCKTDLATCKPIWLTCRCVFAD